MEGLAEEGVSTEKGTFRPSPGGTLKGSPPQHLLSRGVVIQCERPGRQDMGYRTGEPKWQEEARARLWP